MVALGEFISQGVCCALDLEAAGDLRHWDGASDLDGEALNFVAGLSEASSLDISRESGCRPFAFSPRPSPSSIRRIRVQG